MSNKSDKIVVPIIIVLSIIIPIVVAALMFLPDDLRLSFGGADLLLSLPFFHAVLNASTGILLFVGYVMIKNKRFHGIELPWFQHLFFQHFF